MAIIITADLQAFQEIPMTGRERGDQYPRSIPVETTIIQDNATSKKVEVLGWLCFSELSI
jgi:hypothetical protein